MGEITTEQPRIDPLAQLREEWDAGVFEGFQEPEAKDIDEMAYQMAIRGFNADAGLEELFVKSRGPLSAQNRLLYQMRHAHWETKKPLRDLASMYASLEGAHIMEKELRRIPAEDRPLFLAMVNEAARPIERTALGKSATAFLRGGRNTAFNIRSFAGTYEAEVQKVVEQLNPAVGFAVKHRKVFEQMGRQLLGAKAMKTRTQEQTEQDFVDQARDIRESRDPITSENIVARGWYAALQSMTPMAASMGMGGVGGAAFWTAQIAPQRRREYIHEGMDPEIATKAALLAGLLEGAVEMVGRQAPASVRQTLQRAVMHRVVEFAKESGEEPVQEFIGQGIEYIAAKVAKEMGKEAPEIGGEDIMRDVIQAAKEAPFAVMWLAAPGAALELATVGQPVEARKPRALGEPARAKEYEEVGKLEGYVPFAEVSAKREEALRAERPVKEAPAPEPAIAPEAEVAAPEPTAPPEPLPAEPIREEAKPVPAEKPSRQQRLATVNEQIEGWRAQQDLTQRLLKNKDLSEEQRKTGEEAIEFAGQMIEGLRKQRAEIEADELTEAPVEPVTAETMALPTLEEPPRAEPEAIKPEALTPAQEKLMDQFRGIARKVREEKRALTRGEHTLLQGAAALYGTSESRGEKGNRLGHLAQRLLATLPEPVTTQRMALPMAEEAPPVREAPRVAEVPPVEPEAPTVIPAAEIAPAPAPIPAIREMGPTEFKGPEGRQKYIDARKDMLAGKTADELEPRIRALGMEPSGDAKRDAQRIAVREFDENKQVRIQLPPTAAEYGKQNVLVSQETYQRARERLAERRGKVTMGVDPGAYRDLVTMGAYHFEAGVRKFAEWSKTMIQELGERVRPLLDRIWRDLDDTRRQLGVAVEPAVEAPTELPAAEAPPAVPPPPAEPAAATPPPPEPRRPATVAEQPTQIGRPDLANPASEEAVRAMVDEVDAARKRANLPRVRHDVDVQKEADRRMQLDYEIEKQNLLDKGQRDEALDDTETLIAKAMIDREGADAIRSNDPEKLLHARDLIESYRVTGAPVARALRQRTDPIETPENRIRRDLLEAIFTPSQTHLGKENSAREQGRTKDLDGLKQEWAKSVAGLIDKVRAMGIDISDPASVAGDPVMAVRALGQIQAAKADVHDALYEYWVHAILSAPKTQIRNLVGNWAFKWYYQVGVRLGDALVNTVVRDPTGAQWGEFKYVLAGFLPGWSKGARNFVRSFQSETSWFEVSMGSKEGRKLVPHGIAIPGKLGRVVRLPGRLLIAADALGKTQVANLEVQAQAYRIAKAEGLTGEALSQRIAELHDDIHSVAWERAIQMAQRLTFQETDPVIERIQKLIKAIPGMKFLIPFTLTPYNIFKWGARLSPLGAVRLGERIMHGVQTGDWKGITTRGGEQMLAWAVMLALMNNDEEEPWITGTEAMGRRGERALAYRTGRPPMSVKVGGGWFRYNQIEPAGTALALAVDSLRGLRSGDPLEAVTEPLNSLAEQMTDKTFMRGLSDLYRVVQSEQPLDEIGRWASNFAASWIPNILRTGAREARDIRAQRRVWGKKGTSERFNRMVKRAIQGTELGIVPDEPMYDLWGRPVKRQVTPVPGSDWVWRMLTPSDVFTEDIFRGDRVILAWNNQNPDNEYNPSPHAYHYQVKGQTKYWSDEDYAEFCRLAGERARELVETNYLNVDRPTEADLDKIKKAITAGRKWARAQLLQRKQQ